MTGSAGFNQQVICLGEVHLWPMDVSLAKRIYSASRAVKQMDSMDELTVTNKIILNNGGLFFLNDLKPHMLWGLPSFTSYSSRAWGIS